MPGLWARSPVGGLREAADLCVSHTSMFLSLSFSFSTPLSKNKKIKSQKKKDKLCSDECLGLAAKQTNKIPNIKIFNFWHEFSRSSLYGAIPLLNGNIRALNLYMESHKLYNSHFVVYICICSFFLLEQWKRWQNKLSCFYFTSLYTYFMYTLSPKLGFLMSKKRKRNYRLPYSSFLWHYFQPKWLASRGKWQ